MAYDTRSQLTEDENKRKTFFRRIDCEHLHLDVRSGERDEAAKKHSESLIRFATSVSILLQKEWTVHTHVFSLLNSPHFITRQIPLNIPKDIL